MIVPRNFYYECQHPRLGYEAYFIVRMLPASLRRRLIHSPHVPFGATHQCACLTNLYVAPRLRGDGVGRELLALLRRWQDETQTNVAFVASPYSNAGRGLDFDALSSFYDRHGFKAVGHTLYHFRNYQPAS